MYEIRQSNTADGIEFILKTCKHFSLIDFIDPTGRLTPSVVYKLMEVLFQNNYIGQFICAGYSCLVESYLAPDPLTGFLENLNFKTDRVLSQNKIKNHVIPVCYSNEFGYDLPLVSNLTGLGIKEIISLHSKSKYQVLMTGFLPGFFYSTGLHKQLYVNRKRSPDRYVPKGSLAIANQYTGIYPVNSPGGWHVIGRTPIDLVKPILDNNSLIKTGDFIQFENISKARYDELTQNYSTNKTSIRATGKAIMVDVGIQTTIQDLGRNQGRTYGVQQGGAMNKYLSGLANKILDNKLSDAVLEGSLRGVKILFHQPTVISITGLNLTIKINYIPMEGTIFSINENDYLEVFPGPDQMYFYIGTKFGWISKEVMNSKSTNAALGVGILVNKCALHYISFDGILKQKNLVPKIKNDDLRFWPGPEFDMLSPVQKEFIKSGKFEKSPQSNRMAIIFKSECILTHEIEINSMPVIPGMVQLTPDGRLIVLMYDCQTIGGYPRVGYLSESSRDVLALKPPNSKIIFQ